MPAKAVVFGVLLVFMVALLVHMVELFVPLSAKSDMNVICRHGLLVMENKGGLTAADRSELISKLQSRGFVNVVVNGTTEAKQGEELDIHIESDYKYSKLTAFFKRDTETQHMVYEKATIARKVVN